MSNILMDTSSGIQIIFLYVWIKSNCLFFYIHLFHYSPPVTWKYITFLVLLVYHYNYFYDCKIKYNATIISFLFQWMILFYCTFSWCIICPVPRIVSNLIPLHSVNTVRKKMSWFIQKINEIFSRNEAQNTF